MSGWFSRRRRRIALAAPLVFSLLALSRIGYLSMGGHVTKYWGDVFYFGGFSLVGSLIGSLPVMLWFALTKRPPNSPEIMVAFLVSCGLLGLAVGAPTMPSAPYVLAAFGALNALLVGPIYCLIAGAPWRGEKTTSATTA